jgi:FlgD Ig-like domain
MRPLILSVLLILLTIILATAAAAAPCIDPDNGTGTIDYPPQCPSGYLGAMRIVDGLPPGTTIEIEARVHSFYNIVRSQIGASEVQYFSATLEWQMAGTGMLDGFVRAINIPVDCETYTGDRNPGDDLQVFSTDLISMQGELFGDPDFCTLRVAAGSDNGLPSPGSTTLTQLPDNNFNVDCFFDITYQIEFEGCPGSILEDLSGVTQDTQHFQAGETYTDGGCSLPDNGQGTINLPPECPEGYLGDLTIFNGLPPGTTLEIDARLADFTDIQRSLDITCIEPDNGQGTIDFPPAYPDGYLGRLVIIDGLPAGTTLEGPAYFKSFHQIVRTQDSGCIMPDNGIGTVDLPPECPDGHLADLNIIDGLPPGSTIEIIATLADFVTTRYPGGTLGGEVAEFMCEYRLEMIGTGLMLGFNRTLIVPVTGEFHYGPRNPGDPVQVFACNIDGLNGYMVGDPDFDLLQITMGTDFGFPSPGSTTLTDLGDGNFNVDSFFDITYQIDFIGSPGSILDGLSGSTIDTSHMSAGATHADLGETQEFNAVVEWHPEGTGMMTGFSRSLSIPVNALTHSGPRNPGDPIQTFNIELLNLTGQLFGDPDFCSLTLKAGEYQTLPSPGSTTLTQLPSGDFAVDSFFDITYQIEFEGCPGSILEGFAGITTDTRPFQMGEPYSNGEAQDFNASWIWDITGTGDLAGFQRSLYVPIQATTRATAVPAGDVIQIFPYDLTALSGELFGDPDFCTLRVRAGEDHGLPSPGETKIRRLGGGDFAVDSFFDVFYEIEIEGCPGSPLEGISGTTPGNSRIRITHPLSAVPGESPNLLPSALVLHPNAPNPFNPITRIRYEVPAGGRHLKLQIYDMRGRMIRTLVDGMQPEGPAQIIWDGTDGAGARVSSGVYFYSLQSRDSVLTRKMAIIK